MDHGCWKWKTHAFAPAMVRKSMPFQLPIGTWCCLRSNDVYFWKCKGNPSIFIASMYSNDIFTYTIFLSPGYCSAWKVEIQPGIAPFARRALCTAWWWRAQTVEIPESKMTVAVASSNGSVVDRKRRLDCDCCKGLRKLMFSKPPAWALFKIFLSIL